MSEQKMSPDIPLPLRFLLVLLPYCLQVFVFVQIPDGYVDTTGGWGWRIAFMVVFCAQAVTVPCALPCVCRLTTRELCEGPRDIGVFVIQELALHLLLVVYSTHCLVRPFSSPGQSAFGAVWLIFTLISLAYRLWIVRTWDDHQRWVWMGERFRAAENPTAQDSRRRQQTGNATNLQHETGLSSHPYIACDGGGVTNHLNFYEGQGVRSHPYITGSSPSGSSNNNNSSSSSNFYEDRGFEAMLEEEEGGRAEEEEEGVGSGHDSAAVAQSEFVSRARLPPIVLPERRRRFLLSPQTSLSPPANPPPPPPLGEAPAEFPFFSENVGSNSRSTGYLAIRSCRRNESPSSSSPPPEYDSPPAYSECFF